MYPLILVWCMLHNKVRVSTTCIISISILNSNSMRTTFHSLLQLITVSLFVKPCLSVSALYIYQVQYNSIVDGLRQIEHWIDQTVFLLLEMDHMFKLFKFPSNYTLSSSTRVIILLLWWFFNHWLLMAQRRNREGREQQPHS